MKRVLKPLRPGRVSMFVRELGCKLFGHKWAAVSAHAEGQARVGRVCTRCLDAEARDYRGQYPIPR